MTLLLTLLLSVFTLPEVEVTPTAVAEPTIHLAIPTPEQNSIEQVLSTLPGIDIRTRGPHGSQADVSMRGGTFDQVMICLNGIPVSDAQTGHYALNLPVPLSAIERIEVLQGAAASLVGGNALTGAINMGSIYSVSLSYQQNPVSDSAKFALNRHYLILI